MSKELIVDENGNVLSGDIDDFIDSLLTGGLLVFRGASDAIKIGDNQDWIYGSDALVESYLCRSYLVVPELKYFAGVLGPLHCAVQSPDSFIPLHLHGQPIYYYQAADAGNNQSVRHLYTHPDWPKRPSKTGSYRPLMWLSKPVFEKKLHVDDSGTLLMDSGIEIGNAILDGKRQHVLIKNPYKEIVDTYFSCDYWFGFELDLVQYYPGKNSATAQISDSILTNVQSPFLFDESNEISLLISSTGHVSFVIKTGHRTQTLQTSFQGQEMLLGYEMKCHLTERTLRRRKEIIWFVEK